VRARRANLGDTVAAGVLVCDALPASPSSVFDRVDFPLDEGEIGREVLEQPMAAGDLVWVLEAGDQIAGLGVARHRPLERASHVADLTLLVHPVARGRGGGLTLLLAMERAARASTRTHKLVVRVACDDEALKATLAASGAGWRSERVEVEGIRRAGVLLDTELWGLVVGAGPTPI